MILNFKKLVSDQTSSYFNILLFHSVLGSNHRFDIDNVPLWGLYLERDERQLGLAAKGH